jgi:hypothetical protein
MYITKQFFGEFKVSKIFKMHTDCMYRRLNVKLTLKDVCDLFQTMIFRELQALN